MLYVAALPTIVTETFLIKDIPIWIIAIGTISWVFLMWMIVKLSKNPYSKLVAIAAKREDANTLGDVKPSNIKKSVSIVFDLSSSTPCNFGVYLLKYTYVGKMDCGKT